MSIIEKPDWQQRLVIERTELKERSDSLLTALQNADFKAKVPEKIYTLMEEQWETMIHYRTLLEARMDLLKIQY